MIVNQTDRFYCHAEPKAKHLAVAEEKAIYSMARFFASLRFAQNDKLIYSLTNEGFIITNAIVSVSLSMLKPSCLGGLVARRK